MNSPSIFEWDCLPIGLQAGAVSRGQADRLLAVAREASRQLKLGRSSGDRVLAHRGDHLKAGQVVGVIAARDVTLEILPKIDGSDAGTIRQNLVRMLARVIDLPLADGEIGRFEQQHHDLLEIVVRLFCERLFEAIHRGLPRRYVSNEADIPVLRGRLDVLRQFTTLAASPARLACRYDELSPDVALNQIIKAAITCLRRLSRSTENQRRLIALASAFSEVTTVPVRRLPWANVILDRTNGHWGQLFRLSKLILRDSFQTTALGADEGFSLPFEMNRLFEEFVGRIIHIVSRHHGGQVTLQGPRTHALRDMYGQGRLATRPDISISSSYGVSCIIDTKWKELKAASNDPLLGVSPADVYQMMAYGHVHECPRLVLLYPHHRAIGKDPGLLAEFTVGRCPDKRLAIATVDLSEFSTVSAQLEDILCQMVSHSLQRGPVAA
jgi:5-methylcytosine-specific restriction enzyme subunit McrC